MFEQRAFLSNVLLSAVESEEGSADGEQFHSKGTSWPHQEARRCRGQKGKHHDYADNDKYEDLTLNPRIKQFLAP